jgi:hypothetical protein
VCRPGPLEIGSGKLTDIVVGGTAFSKVQQER